MKTSDTIAINASGMEFNAEVAGPDDGQLVLFLHGYPMTPYTWRREITAVADAGYRACAPYQRGYSPGARPEGIEPYRIEYLMEDALAIADALGKDRFHVVGHDFGGGIAWYLALLHPDRIFTLSVLSRPHPAAYFKALADDPGQSSGSGHHKSHLEPEATDRLMSDGETGFRALLRRGRIPEQDIEGYAATLDSRALMDAALNWYRARPLIKIDGANLPAATVPTLYVWGSEDHTVGRMAAELTKDYVDAPYTFVEVEGAGHYVSDELPGKFTSLLLAHLAGDR